VTWKDAPELGLESAWEDVLGLRRLPLPLFRDRRGQREYSGRILAIAWGRWKDIDVRLFSYRYTYRERQRRFDGREEFTGKELRYEYEGAITELPVRFPVTVIDAAGGAAGGGQVGRFMDQLTDQIETTIGANKGRRYVKHPYRAFAEAFRVESENPDFARALLTPRMREWLVERGRDWRYELAGRWVMACTEPRADHDPSLLELAQTLRRFVRRIPEPLLERFRRAATSRGDPRGPDRA
jgi:hypothetical protein